MILRNRSALDGKQPKLSWTVAMDVMPGVNRSVDEQFAGLHRHLGPTNGLARPQRLLPFLLFFPTPTPLQVLSVPPAR